MESTLKKILVIEDERPLRLALKEKLEHEGYVVVEAVDGEEGLKVALEAHPDLIVLDILMPKMDGLEMAKRLRQDEWGAKVPVIVLTNATDLSRVGLAMENSIFEYFVKTDIKIQEVIDKVKALV